MLRVSRSEIHATIYFAGLLVIAAAMSFSVYITSVAHFIIIANYLVEGRYIEKLRTLWSRKSILLFLMLIGVHFVWIINTSDFAYATNDIRIKLPLLALPIIVGTSKALTYKQIKILLLVFAAAILANTLIASIIMQTTTIKTGADDFRDASFFVSHIRLSLMIVLSIFILLWFVINRKTKSRIEFVAYLLVSVWLVVFLLISQFFTGIVLLFVVGTCFILWRILKLSSRRMKITAFSFTGLAILGISAMAFHQIKSFYHPPVRSMDQVLKQTENGNWYYHDRNSRVTENGNLVYVEISELELRQAWEQRSRLSIDSLDSQHQPVIHTLIRYLASKGLPKDANAVMSLSDQEVMAIEDGIPNIRFVDGINFSDRIYQFIWQIDFYLKEGNPSGHSLTQRIEYVKAGMHILKSNFWTGVGTGDLQIVFDRAYNEIHSKLEKPFRHRAHNQILTFYIAFGVVGATLCLIAMFFPIIIEPKNTKYFISVFIIIALISMCNEDTLETATGSAFFAYFYSLFLWGFQEFTTNEK